jgi:hypothetical protein
MNDLIKNSLKQKNIGLKNKMPQYMVKAGQNKGNINIDKERLTICHTFGGGL